MKIHRSNRAEILLSSLAEVVATPCGGPLATECIVVQGKGMERWLTMELARIHGVWANPDFPFPRTVIERAFTALLGVDSRRGWDSSALSWAIAKTLGQEAGSDFQIIKDYLVADRDGERLLQLAERIASVFDGYAVYRPELLRQWEAGREQDWQAQLWRELVSKHGFQHTGSLEGRFLEALRSTTGPIQGFPTRICLFGISALPPMYLRVLNALSSRVDVHAFVLSPSQEYWSDIRKHKDVLRAQLDSTPTHLEVGNALLASLGRLHQDFQLLLERDVDYLDAGDTYQPSHRPETLLGSLHDDILYLRDRQPDGPASPLPLNPADNSISVHSCHSPMRELTVLRDQLLARLDADPTLQPRDIIVMAPRVEDYAAYVDAVFGDTGALSLPFHVADRPVRATQPAINAFAKLLQLAPSRFAAPSVLDFLALEPVRSCFEITTDDLPIIRRWVAESNIRWARNKAHREEVGQPADPLNTWQWGLDRLLLGYASPSQGHDLFEDVLAFDDMEGSETEVLGHFVDFCESLFALQGPLTKAHTIAEWQPILERALATMIDRTDDNAEQHQVLRQSFAALSGHAARYGFERNVSLAALSPKLDVQWQANARSNFMSGGLTFCQLMPMRAIPHRVVCIIGMNHDAFPRQGQDLGFDYVANHPKLGDRTPRDDDRYLFLEALLSARDSLVITYTGQSEHSNAVLPPSVVVDELLDVLDDSFAATTPSVREQVVVRHPLQPFSDRYFSGTDDRLFSYSSQYCQGAQSLASKQVSPESFLDAALNDSSCLEDARVSLDELIRFFSRPAKTFVERRTGVRLRADVEPLQEREAFALDGLERWRVGDQLLEIVLANPEETDRSSIESALRASGILPQGTPGAVFLGDVLPLVDNIAAAARAWRVGGSLDSLAIESKIGEITLTGSLLNIWQQCRQEVSYSRIAGRREMAAWIEHLALCMVAPQDYPLTTVSVGRKLQSVSTVQFSPVENPAELLETLLRLYQLGQSIPLPLFSLASRQYAETSRKGDLEKAMQSALKSYEGDRYHEGDLADQYVRQLFKDSKPLSAGYRPFSGVSQDYQDFASLALSVYQPLLDHREELT